MALIQLVDTPTNSLTNRMSSICVFIYLSKAFDTIDHSILSKLEHYGSRGVTHKWFCDYLDNIKQYSVVNHYSSSLMTIQHGVRQDSILGPLIFLLYVNDLHHSSSLLSFILFANDTTILFSHPDFPTLVDILNNELDSVSSWFRTNKLSWNSTKTKHMVFIYKCRCYLVHLYSWYFYWPPGSFYKVSRCKLSWSEHISHISKVISQLTFYFHCIIRSFFPILITAISEKSHSDLHPVTTMWSYSTPFY